MMKLIKTILITIILIYTSSGTAETQAKVLSLQATPTTVHLRSHWQVLEDKTGSVDITTLMNAAQSTQSTQTQLMFQPLKSDLSVSYTRSVYWLKLELQRHDSQTPSEWWMEITPNMLDDVRAYHVIGGNIISQHLSGDHRRTSEAEMRHRLALFRLHLNDTEIHTIYLRLQTTSAMYLSARLFTPQSFAEESNKQSTLIGIFYGIMLSMIAYNLILMMGYRDKANIFYLILSTLTLLVGFNNNGHLGLFFASDNIWLTDLLQSLAVPGILLFYSLFISSFLRLAEDMPRLAFVFRLIQSIALCTMVAVLMGFNSSVAAIIQIIAFLQILIVIPLGMVIGLRGFRPGYFVVAASTAWVTGAILIVLRNLGLIESTWQTEFGYQIGAAIEIILLALAQADRINLIKNDNARTQAALLSMSQRAEQELESKIQQRTQELASAVQRLEKLDKQKNEFLGIAAHDLKNPLTGIIGLSDLMRKLAATISEEQRASYLERISRSGQRMMHIITNLLDLNALDSGDAKLEKKPVNLNEITHQVLLQYEHTMQVKELNCIVNHHHDSDSRQSHHLIISADPNACFQVLDNVISNAIKYSPLGKQIQLTLNYQNDFAEVRIQDQGPGLSTQDQQHLFEKFSKLSSIPTGGEHSTGLGLSIVKQLSEAMGGSVRCESELGKGCCFILRFPLLTST